MSRKPIILCDLNMSTKWASQARTLQALKQFTDEVVDTETGDLARLVGRTVFSFGWLKYSKRKEEIQDGLEFCQRLIQVVTDYEHPPIVQMRRAVDSKPNVALSNIPTRPLGRHWEWVDDWCYIDWNLLSWNSVPLLPIRPEIYPHLFYFGRWREDRGVYFKRYFDTDLYPTTVSCGSLNRRSFKKKASDQINFVQKIPDVTKAANYLITIYAEDTYIHQNFHSVANRFYECLRAGIPQAIDANCANTFERASIPNWHLYAVEGPEGILRLMHRGKKTLMAEQRGLWVRDYAMSFHQSLTHELGKRGVFPL